jgi:hypothetical protein
VWKYPLCNSTAQSQCSKENLKLFSFYKLIIQYKTGCWFGKLMERNHNTDFSILLWYLLSYILLTIKNCKNYLSGRGNSAF